MLKIIMAGLLLAALLVGCQQSPDSSDPATPPERYELFARTATAEVKINHYRWMRSCLEYASKTNWEVEAGTELGCRRTQ